MENKVEQLKKGFYVVGSDTAIIAGPYKNSRKAYAAGIFVKVPFAILEVLEDFNNFAWGE